jgi:transposase
MKIPRQSYTLEFKELAVKRVKDGQSFSSAAKELGMNEQTLRNWAGAAARGALTGLASKTVSAEQMELSRLRAENVRLKRENEIIKKAEAYFAKDVL